MTNAYRWSARRISAGWSPWTRTTSWPSSPTSSPAGRISASTFCSWPQSIFFTWVTKLFTSVQYKRRTARGKRLEVPFLLLHKNYWKGAGIKVFLAGFFASTGLSDLPIWSGKQLKPNHQNVASQCQTRCWFDGKMGHRFMLAIKLTGGRREKKGGKECQE